MSERITGEDSTEVLSEQFDSGQKVRVKRSGETGVVKGEANNKVSVSLHATRRMSWYFPASLEALPEGCSIDEALSSSNSTATLGNTERISVAEGSNGSDDTQTDRPTPEAAAVAASNDTSTDTGSVLPGAILLADGVNNVGGNTPRVNKRVSAKTNS